jgi:hypothetical protein
MSIEGSKRFKEATDNVTAAQDIVLIMMMG